MKNITKEMQHALSYEMIHYCFNFSLKHNFLYAETAKVACSTIKRLLIRTENLYDRQDAPIDAHNRDKSPLHGIKDHTEEIFNAVLQDPYIYKFSFVRNPYTRILSAYLDKIIRNKRPKKEILNIMNVDLNKNPEALEKHISFEEFLEAVKMQNLFEMNIHWRPQYYHIRPDLIDYNKIGRFETFDNDIKEVIAVLKNRVSPYVQNKVKYKMSAPHKTNSNEKVYQFYNSNARKLVSEIYACDFDTYKYKFPE